MTTNDLTLAPVDHPAKWSQPILDAIAEVIAAEAEQEDRRLRILDPFAGVGRARLAEALTTAVAYEVVGVELQPEWACTGSSVGTGDAWTVQGDATDLPADWAGEFDAVVTSPCYGNRMADHHDAADPCKVCSGFGNVQVGAERGEHPPAVCKVCKGTGLSWRNTYAHALRRQGGDLVPGSAAGVSFGWKYRELHRDAITEMLRVVRPNGLLCINMSNHIKAGAEVHVNEWWLNELIHRQCRVVEVRRIGTRRQRNGANGEARVDGEVLIVVRTPSELTLL